MINCKQQQQSYTVVSSVTHLSHLLSLHYLLSQHLHIGCHCEARSLENLFEKDASNFHQAQTLGLFLTTKEIPDDLRIYNTAQFI